MARGGGRRRILIGTVARVLGALAGAAIPIAWARFVFFTPLGADAGPPLWLAVAIFGGLGLAGMGAALRRDPVVQGVAGLISFFPVGLYLLLAPGVARWIGVADLVLLLSAWLAWQADDLPGPG